MKLSILLILFGISQVMGGQKNIGGKSTRQFCVKGRPDYSLGAPCSFTNMNCGPYGLCIFQNVKKAKWSYIERRAVGGQGQEWLCICFKTKKSRKSAEKKICSKKYLVKGGKGAGGKYGALFKSPRYSWWFSYVKCT
jgi:hypothetical protein